MSASGGNGATVTITPWRTTCRVCGNLKYMVEEDQVTNTSGYPAGVHSGGSGATSPSWSLCLSISTGCLGMAVTRIIQRRGRYGGLYVSGTLDNYVKRLYK